MRTRAQGPPSPPPRTSSLVDNRKRRQSDAVHKANERWFQASKDIEAYFSESDHSPSGTPTKSAKRVRFSSPEAPVRDTPAVDTSTGLTPCLKRTFLDTSSSVSSKAPRSKSGRRSASLPALDLNHGPTIPTRKRWLEGPPRRHSSRGGTGQLSSTDKAQARKTSPSAQDELYRIRNDLQVKEHTIQDLTLELELQKHRNMDIFSDSGLPTPTEECPKPTASSPFEDETFFSSPSSYTARAAAPMDYFQAGRGDVTMTDAACQTSFTETVPLSTHKQLKEDVETLKRERRDATLALQIIHSEIRGLGFGDLNSDTDELITSVREAFRGARLELERLLPGETEGGFNDGKFLLEAFNNHIHSLLQKVDDCSKTIDFHQQTSSALRRNLNNTLEKLEAVENRAASLDSHQQAWATRLAESHQKTARLEENLVAKQNEVDCNKERLEQLEGDHQNRCTSIERLQTALNSYRQEVATLEALVVKLEDEKQLTSTENEVVQRLHRDTVSERDTLLTNIKQLHQQIEDLTSRLQLADTAQDEAFTRVYSLERALEAAESKCQAQADTLAQQSEALSTLSETNQWLEAESHAFRSSIQNLEQANENQRYALEQARDEANRNNKKLSLTRQDFEGVKTALDSVTKEFEEKQAQLKLETSRTQELQKSLDDARQFFQRHIGIIQKIMESANSKHIEAKVAAEKFLAMDQASGLGLNQTHASSSPNRSRSAPPTNSGIPQLAIRRKSKEKSKKRDSGISMCDTEVQPLPTVFEESTVVQI